MQETKKTIYSNKLVLTRKTEIWASQQQAKTYLEKPEKPLKNKQPLSKAIKQFPSKQCSHCQFILVYNPTPYKEKKQKENDQEQQISNNKTPKKKIVIVTWRCDQCQKTYNCHQSAMQCKQCQKGYDMCITCYKQPGKSEQDILNEWKQDYTKKYKKEARKKCSMKLCWSKTENLGFICKNCQKIKDYIEKQMHIKQLELNLKLHNQKKLTKNQQKSSMQKYTYLKQKLDLELDIANNKYQLIPKIPKKEYLIEEKQKQIQIIIEKQKELIPINRYLEIEAEKIKIRKIRDNIDNKLDKYTIQENILNSELKILNLQLDIFNEFPEQKEKIYHSIYVKKTHLQLVNDQKYLDVKIVEEEKKKDLPTYVLYQIDIQILNLVIYLYKENLPEIQKIQKIIQKRDKEYEKFQEKQDQQQENISEKKKLKNYLKQELIRLNVYIQILQLRLRYIHDQEEDNITQQIISQQQEYYKDIKKKYYLLNKKQLGSQQEGEGEEQEQNDGDNNEGDENILNGISDNEQNEEEEDE